MVLHKLCFGRTSCNFSTWPAGRLRLRQQAQRQMIFNPSAAVLVSDGDVLIVMGEQPELETVPSEAGVRP